MVCECASHKCRVPENQPQKECIYGEMHRPLLHVALFATFCACYVHGLRPVIRLPRDAETTSRYIAVLQEGTSHQRLLEIVEYLRNLSDGCKVHNYIEVAMKAVILDLSDDTLQKVKLIVCAPVTLPRRVCMVESTYIFAVHIVNLALQQGIICIETYLCNF